MKQLYTFLLALLVATGATAQVQLQRLGSVTIGAFDEGAAEIGTYFPGDSVLFVTNADSGRIEIVSLVDPTNPVSTGSLDYSAYGGGVQSVAWGAGLLAAALENPDSAQGNGLVAFWNAAGEFIDTVEVGALPDMLTFSPDFTKIATANEGEPNDLYSNDPEGSVSIIAVPSTVPAAGTDAFTQSDVTTITFTNFSLSDVTNFARTPRAAETGTSRTVAQDLEPEYIAFQNNDTLVVACQENNALVQVDLTTNTATALIGLGRKDHSMMGNGIDASDRDDSINIATYANVYGLYQPDAIDAYTVNGTTYFVSANEGDGREYEFEDAMGDDQISYIDEARVEDLTLDTASFGGTAITVDSFQNESVLGRLTVMTTEGDTDGDGAYEELYAYGARSFSIWGTDGSLVYDSGDDFEQYIATNFPDDFNSSNDDNDDFDSRSDAKGPEPEAVTVGKLGNNWYAFIGLERFGGVMVYDITDPANATRVDFASGRDFSIPADTATSEDLGPEDIVFIDSTVSPNGKNLIAVMHEVSGNIAIWQVNDLTISTPDAAPARAPFMLYPNPASTVVRFNQAADVTVYDVQGREVARATNTRQLNIADWTPGMYFFRTTDGRTTRLVKN